MCPFGLLFALLSGVSVHQFVAHNEGNVAIKKPALVLPVAAVAGYYLYKRLTKQPEEGDLQKKKDQ